MPNYYEDGDDVRDQPQPTTVQEVEEPQKEEGGETALVPTSIFPEPPKPGDVCDFRVVRVHNDEVEIQYETMQEGEHEMGEEKPTEMGNPGDASMSNY